MTPTLASLFIGEWFGPAPTIIGLVLLAFWAWVRWSNRPVERLNFRFMGVVLLVISSSLWLGFEKGGASTTGYGGDFGAFFAGRFAEGWIGTLAMFFVGLAALLSIPLATDWLFLPMFLKYRTKQGLAAAPVLGTVGGYKIVGAYAHDGSGPPAPPVATGEPAAAESADAPDGSEGEEPTSAATAVADPEADAADDDAPSDDRTDDDIAPPAAEAESDLPWYMRRRPRGAAASAPRTADDDLAPRTNVARTREETTAARFQLEPEAEPEPAPTYESRRRSRASRYAEPEVESATPPAVETSSSDTDEGTTNDTDTDSFRASAVAEPETYEETEADATPSIDEIAQAPVAERTEQPEAPAAATTLDAALDDAFAFADDPPRAAAAEPASPTIEEAATATVTDADARGSESTHEPELASGAAESTETAAIEDDAAEFTTTAEHADDDEHDDQDEGDEVDASNEPALAADPTPARSTVVETEPSPAVATLSDDDLAFVKAGDLVVAQSKASISFLQKQLGVGYFQAAKLLDRLEKEKIIGPYTGGVNRDVLIDLVEWQAKKSSMA